MDLDDDKVDRISEFYEFKTTFDHQEEIIGLITS